MDLNFFKIKKVQKNMNFFLQAKKAKKTYTGILFFQA